MAIADTDDTGPKRWRIHPVLDVIMAGTLIWGALALCAYSMLPVARCLVFSAMEPASCDAALAHPLARGELRWALLRLEVNGYVTNANYAAALKASEALVTAGQADASDYMARGVAQSGEGKPAESAKEYRAALRLDPGNDTILESLMSALQAADARDEARGEARAFIARNPNSVAGYAKLGWMDYQDGRYAEANVNLKLAAEKAPADAEMQNQFALGLDEEGRDEEALVAYGKAIAIEPSNITFLNNRGMLHRELERHAEAQADFKRSLGISRSLNAIVGLARSYTNEEKFGLAEPLVREALALDPESEDARIARIRLEFERKDYAKARQAVVALQQLNPESEDAIYWLASIDDEEGQDEKALAGYRSLLEKWPRNADLRVDVGNALVDLGRPDEAVLTYTTAIAMNPRSELGYRQRAFAHVRLKRWQAAIADANAAIARDGRVGRSYFHRAYAEWQSNDMAAARKDYEMAAQLKPGDGPVNEEHVEFLIADGALAAAQTKLDAMQAQRPDDAALRDLRERLVAAKAADSARSE